MREEKVKKIENTITTITSPDENSFIRINEEIGGYEVYFLNHLFSRKELEGLQAIVQEALKIKN